MITSSTLLSNFDYEKDEVECFYPCTKTDCFRYQKWGVVLVVRREGGCFGRKKERQYHFVSVEKSTFLGNQCLSCSHFTGVDLYKKNESA